VRRATPNRIEAHHATRRPNDRLHRLRLRRRAVAVARVAIDRLGKYELLAEIRYGGLGRVYKAQDPLLKRLVALKVLSEDRVTDAVRARFLAEARASATLTHRNIVAVYDAGEDQGRLYVVMEYVDGERIEEVIRRRSEVPLESKLEIMRQVCRGLRYAHEKGVAHADVHADNVMVLPDGTVKLLDCGLAGIALTAQAAASPTAPAALAASPSQAAERARTGGDRRADIFSAAALFYELTASGTPAALGSARASAQASHAGAPMSLFAPDPSIPAELGAVLERALMRDPAARFQEMAEMEAALEKLGSGRPRPGVGARWPPPTGGIAKSAPTSTVTFPVLPTAVASPPIEPSADERIAPARPGAMRRIAAMVAARPVTAMVGTAAIALIGAGAVYWYIAMRTAAQELAELNVALQQLAAARAAATRANAELLSAERFADATGLDRAQRDLVEMQHRGEAAASARAAAQAYIDAAREAAGVARAAADSAHAGMRADKTRGRAGTPEHDRGLREEAHGDEHYAAGRFSEAGHAFRSAAHLFAQGSSVPVQAPPVALAAPPAGATGPAPPAEPPAPAAPPAAATPPAPGAPPVAAAPPSSAAPPATNADAQIREVLRAYTRAFETKDLELLQHIRLGMTPAEVTRHQNVFAQTQSYRVGLRIDRIVVRGNEAEVRGEREDTIVTTSGDTIRHPPGDFRVALRRVGERWRVDRVR